MRSIALLVLAAMFAGTASSLSQAQESLTEDGLIGEWVLPGNGSVIRAYRCGEAFCDANVAVEQPKRWDSAPKDKVPGLLIPSNLQKKGPATWYGKLRNLRDGDTYEGTITLIDKNRLTFVRCLIGSVLCDTKTFLRVDPPSPAPAQTPPPAQQRAVAPARLEVAAPSPPVAKPKARPKVAARQPTRADFEAFLKQRSTSNAPVVAAEEPQVLFKEFMAWRSKQ
jgi:uncharacterized protein (DUF2147 family)